jgi:undecaprenyl-diphosphatase
MQNVVINITITAPIVVGLALGACALLSRGRVAAALCVAGLLTALTGLTIGVHTHGWVTGLDAATASRFAAHPTYRFYVASLAIAHLASPAATAAAGLIAGALLSWRARSVIPGVVVIGTVGAAALAQTALKAAVRRPASPAELPFPLVRYDHPFPSGHVTGTAALLGIVAVCVGVGRTRTLRAWLAGSGVVGVLVVAVTRLYLGVHWLTDAVGGAVLGGVFVTMGAAVFSALHARSRPEGTTPPVIAPARRALHRR